MNTCKLCKGEVPEPYEICDCLTQETIRRITRGKYGK